MGVKTCKWHVGIERGCFTHLFASDDDDERGAGRGESPREQGSEERLNDRWMILEHRVRLFPLHRTRAATIDARSLAANCPFADARVERSERDLQSTCTQSPALLISTTARTTDAQTSSHYYHTATVTTLLLDRTMRRTTCVVLLRSTVRRLVATMNRDFRISASATHAHTTE